MITTGYPSHLLRLADLTAAQVGDLLDLAEEMAAAPEGWVGSFPGAILSMVFEKPSTRTRVSFAAAAARLGMQPVSLSPNELQLGRGETIADTARILSGYSAAIAVRTFAQSVLAEMAAVSRVPVINALSDDHHPCQALADLLTLRQVFGRLSGLTVAYVGDGNDNVVHSLMEAAALTGINLRVASPAGYRPRPDVEDTVRLLAERSGARLDLFSDAAEAVAGAGAVYTDVWVSMGADAERERRLSELAGFQVTPALMARAAPEAVFMHCLPAHRGEEVVDAVIDGPRSAVWRQAENRMHTEQALLYRLLGRG